MVRVSIDIVFDKSELLRMSVHVLRTIELDALQIFKAVVDCGGVTRAAAQLHRVPSNITTRLKRLEEGLGTKARTLSDRIPDSGPSRSLP
jgi:Bacterial regulatory helix-turn-helix protein, lysR family